MEPMLIDLAPTTCHLKSLKGFFIFEFMVSNKMGNFCMPFVSNKMFIVNRFGFLFRNLKKMFINGRKKIAPLHL